jgi:hypothetical protein
MGEARYEEALTSLNDLARVLGSSVPSIELPQRANILAFQAAYYLRNAQLALDACNTLSEQTPQIFARKPSAEGKYRAHYIFQLCEFAAGRFPDLEEGFLAGAARVAEVPFDYQFEAVPSYLKSYMPIGPGSQIGADARP